MAGFALPLVISSRILLTLTYFTKRDHSCSLWLYLYYTSKNTWINFTRKSSQQMWWETSLKRLSLKTAVLCLLLFSGNTGTKAVKPSQPSTSGSHEAQQASKLDDSLILYWLLQKETRWGYKNVLFVLFLKQKLQFFSVLSIMPHSGHRKLLKNKTSGIQRV